MESNQDDVVAQFAEQRAEHWQSIVERFPSRTPSHIVEALRLQWLHLLADDPCDVFIIKEFRTPTMHRICTRLRPHIATAFERMAVEMQTPRFAVRSRMPSDREVSRVPRGILAAIATGRMDYLQ